MEIVIIEKTAFDMLLAGVKALEDRVRTLAEKGGDRRMDGHGGRVPYAEHNPEDLAGHARQARHCIFPNRTQVLLQAGGCGTAVARSRNGTTVRLTLEVCH